MPTNFLSKTTKFGEINMNRTEWLESLKPKSKANYSYHDGTLHNCVVVEMEIHERETLVKICTEKNKNLFAYWVNAKSLLEPTDGLISEMKLDTKINRLKKCVWRIIDDDKINAVYDILFGDPK
jgi:hypothetical protein